MASISNESGSGVLLRYKMLAYIVTLLAALVATDPTLKFWSLAYLFPLGLAAFANLRWGNDGGYPVLWLCVAVYVVHAFFFFRAGTKRSMVLWLVVLIALLICNVAGCRAQLPRH